jgi:hypothetical protein
MLRLISHAGCRARAFLPGTGLGHLFGLAKVEQPSLPSMETTSPYLILVGRSAIGICIPTVKKVKHRQTQQPLD